MHLICFPFLFFCLVKPNSDNSFRPHRAAVLTNCFQTRNASHGETEARRSQHRRNVVGFADSSCPSVPPFLRVRHNRHGAASNAVVLGDSCCANAFHVCEFDEDEECRSQILVTRFLFVLGAATSVHEPPSMKNPMKDLVILIAFRMGLSQCRGECLNRRLDPRNFTRLRHFRRPAPNRHSPVEDVVGRDLLTQLMPKTVFVFKKLL